MCWLLLQSETTRMLNEMADMETRRMEMTVEVREKDELRKRLVCILLSDISKYVPYFKLYCRSLYKMKLITATRFGRRKCVTAQNIAGLQQTFNLNNFVYYTSTF